MIGFDHLKAAIQYLHEILTLIGEDRRKLPALVVLFLGVSLLDFAGLGLIAPYITLDGEEIEFSGGFTDLHTLVYQHTLEGQGFGLEEAKTAIQIVHDIRIVEPSGITTTSHPFLKEN